MNIGTLTVLLTANTVGLNKATAALRNLNRAGNSATAGMVGGMNAANAAALNLGRSLTQFLTLPIGIFGASAMKTFMEFEFNLAKIEGLVGVAEEQTKAWGQSIMNLSKVVGKGPVELSDALYFITSSGYDTIEAMEILEITAKAAAAGLGETRYVADVVTSAMNAYRGTALTAAKATDILVATIKLGKGEVDKMVASMGVALPVASKLGVGMDEVGAAMAAMTRTGTTVATSAVQVRQMFNSLMKPAAQSRENIKKMGSSYEELRNILREKGLAEMLQKVMDLTGGNAAQMAKLFPNIRALNGIIEITGDNFETFKTVLDGVTNSTGSTEEAFRIAQKTLKQQLGVELARFSVILIKTGNVLKEVLLPLLRGIIDVLEWLGSLFGMLSQPMQSFIAMIGVLAAAIGPLILLFKGLGIAVGFVKTAFDFLKVAISANPVGALIVGITTIVGLMAQWYVLTKNQTAAQKALNKEVRMKQMLETATDRQKTLSELGILNFDESKSGSLYERVQYTKAAEQSAMNALKTMSPNKVVATQMVIVDEMVALRKKIDNIKSGGGTLADELQLQNLEGMLSMYGRLKTTIDAYVKSDEDYRKQLQEGETNMDAYADAIEDAEKSLKKYKEELLLVQQRQAMFGKAYDASSDLLSAYNNRLEFLITVQQGASKEALTLIERIRDLQVLMEGGISTKKLDFGNLFEYFQEARKLPEIYGKLIEDMGVTNFDASSNKFTSLTPDLKERVENYGKSTSKVMSFNDALKKSVVDLFSGMEGVITNALNSTENVFKAFAKFFGDFVKGLIFKLVAATIAALALVFVISLIPGLGDIAAFKAIKDAKTFGAGLNAALGVTMGTGLAEGGIVPKGYSNDTFHARLSTDEAVIPLKKLPQLLGLNNSRNQKVVFVIEGHTIQGVLQDADNISNAY